MRKATTTDHFVRNVHPLLYLAISTRALVHFIPVLLTPVLGPCLFICRLSRISCPICTCNRLSGKNYWETCIVLLLQCNARCLITSSFPLRMGGILLLCGIGTYNFPNIFKTQIEVCSTRPSLMVVFSRQNSEV